jgi:hypothetical protein
VLSVRRNGSRDSPSADYGPNGGGCSSQGGRFLPIAASVSRTFFRNSDDFFGKSSRRLDLPHFSLLSRRGVLASEQVPGECGKAAGKSK